MMSITLADDPVIPEISLGDWIEDAVNWLKDNIGAFFDFIKTILEFLVNHLTDGLTSIPTFVLVAILTLLALWLTSWGVALFTVIGFLLIDSMRFWDHAMMTLSLVIVSGIIAILIAVPVGILAARFRTVSILVKPVLDFMQTMPVFVYLIPAVFFFSIGVAPGVIATVVFSIPPGVRFTELGIRQVEPDTVEAGEAFGAAPRKILSGIQIPLAMKTIMGGINQVIMLALSMVVVASMAGAPGLGTDVYSSITTVNIGLGVESGLAVVIVAIYLDRLTASFATSRSRVGFLKPVLARLFARRAPQSA